MPYKAEVLFDGVERLPRQNQVVHISPLGRLAGIGVYKQSVVLLQD